MHVARGSAEINGKVLHDGDGLSIQDVSEIHLAGIDLAELLLFDLP